MLDSKYSSMTASKRLGSSEDGRRFVRRLATNFFVILLRLLFGTKLSDTHGMKAIKKTEIEKDIEKDIVLNYLDIADESKVKNLFKKKFKI